MYTTHMPSPQRSRRETTVVTVRLYQSQINALKALPRDVTISALARALFQQYLAGAVPNAFALAKRESELAQQAQASSIKK